MGDKDEVLKKVGDEIKGVAKAIEDFADKVTADQEPVVIIPTDQAPPPKRPAEKG